MQARIWQAKVHATESSYANAREITTGNITASSKNNGIVFFYPLLFNNIE